MTSSNEKGIRTHCSIESCPPPSQNVDIINYQIEGKSSNFWTNTKDLGMEIPTKKLKIGDTESPAIYAEIFNESSGSKSTIKSDLKVENKLERGRKFTKRTTREAKEQRKIFRNRGQKYVTESGKVVNARVFRSLSSCRMKCSERFDEAALRKLFAEYWSAGDRTKRADYLAKLITSKPKRRECIRENYQDKSKYRQYKHTYHLKINGSKFPICKGCFRRTFNESNKFIEVLLYKKLATSSNSIINDTRGKISPEKKWSEDILQKVRERIQSVPAYDSSFSEKDTSKHMPSHYTLAMLYEEYMECCASLQAEKEKTKILKLKLTHKDEVPCK